METSTTILRQEVYSMDEYKEIISNLKIREHWVVAVKENEETVKLIYVYRASNGEIYERKEILTKQEK